MTTRWLDRDGGEIAYSEDGRGPLVVCVPGLGDLRQEYRFLGPQLTRAGLRVVTLDLRGHGDSSVGWSDVSVEAVGGDILALVERLGGPAIVVGTSMAAAAAVWAAAEEPAAIAGLVLIGPFVREGGCRGRGAVYPGLIRLALAGPWKVRVWMRYWASLFPTRKPDDFRWYADRLRRNLSQPGRFDAARRMLGASRAGSEAKLDSVRAPALVVMGTKDRDFKDPAAEARLVAARLHGNVALIDDAGHYPHVEFPERTAPLVAEFALCLRKAHAPAARTTVHAAVGADQAEGPRRK